MVSPWTSKVCKHSFSDSIKSYISAQGGKAECPVQGIFEYFSSSLYFLGCKSYVCLGDLFLDKKLARQIVKYKQTQQEIEEDDGEEIVV